MIADTLTAVAVWLMTAALVAASYYYLRADK